MTRSVSLAFRLLAAAGILLGTAGITLFVLSRRGRRPSPFSSPIRLGATPMDDPRLSPDVGG